MEQCTVNVWLFIRELMLKCHMIPLFMPSTAGNAYSIIRSIPKGACCWTWLIIQKKLKKKKKKGLHGSKFNRYKVHHIIICVPTWLNEALCGKPDSELQAKNMSQGQNFSFLMYSFLNLHHTEHSHDKHFWKLKMWKKRGVMEHFLFDWP